MRAWLIIYIYFEGGAQQDTDQDCAGKQGTVKTYLEINVNNAQRLSVMAMVSLLGAFVTVMILAQPALAAPAYTIGAGGAGCSAIGTWSGSTCTMNQDISVADMTGISITADNVILDGAGHTIAGDSDINSTSGVQTVGHSGIVIKNLNIHGFSNGVLIWDGTGNIYGNNITACGYGVNLYSLGAGANNNYVFYNTLQSNTTGLQIYNSDTNHVYRNNFVSNGTQAKDVNGGTGNVFNLAGTIGNYWDDFDSRSEGCLNPAGPSFNMFCDSVYSFTGNQDNGPYIFRNSWSRSDWTWYDNVGGDDWVLLANRPGSGNSFSYRLSIAQLPQAVSSLPGGGPGFVTPGTVLYNKYSGVVNGPVSSEAAEGGSAAISSQRILWPKGGNSLEEVTGKNVQTLDSRFYWPWYDMASPGYKDWILISNPNTYQIHYSVKIAGVTRIADATIIAGGRENLTFPGVMGGPVQVDAWNDQGDPAFMMASQRVLSSGDTAFNEVTGLPQSEMASDYFWTWYDMQSAGAQNWILIANPNSAGGNQVYYQIYVGGVKVQEGGPIAPGANITPTFPGLMNGPVEVKTFSNAGFSVPEKSIASQRCIFGPSFEEVIGVDENLLDAKYDWTWYDQSSPGATNWVLVGNPSASETVTATVSFTDSTTGAPQTASANIPPGGRWTPTFNGKMGGPVHTSAVLQGTSTERPVIASQRVLWNGFFNEVWGQ